jgi:hypothetical protein
MIIITEEDYICKCGHRAKQHGSYGRCYYIIHPTKRIKVNGSYKKIQLHYQCTCEKIERIEK